MKKNHCYSANFDEKTEFLFRKSVFLGQGNNGIVYKLPDNKVIKLFVQEKVCRDEASILIKTRKSKYFPKMYSKGDLYIVREMVNGIQLDKYIKRYGLDAEICKNLYKLLKEFRKLKFTKIDARCKDIFVLKNKKIMIIDPKKYYKREIDYPRHLMKGLNKLGMLEFFLDNIREIDKDIVDKWLRLEQASKYNRHIRA